MRLADIQNIDSVLAASEAMVHKLRPGCEKHVVWADLAGVKTPLSLLYIHGFSASPQELRPLPDIVARSLGANLHFTRLTGHGQDGQAMGSATLADWQRDVSEAFEVARTIGNEVIVMGCSTGCTLATLALAYGMKARAAVYISPNFGLRNALGQTLLDLPGVRGWGRFVAGSTRKFEPINAAHRAYWTTEYPTTAVYPMADAVRAVRDADLSKIETPGLFAYNLQDQVISPSAVQKTMARWGGHATPMLIHPGAGDDKMGHVMAGDVFSPSQTAPLAERILAWCRAL